MRSLRSFPLSVLAVILLSATAAKPQAVAPSVRIVNAIDESNLITLKGNTHPLANAKNDRGPVSPSLPMTDLILLLSRSSEQQAAFDKFVANQYDPHSPDFHRWLEPAQVGEDFGPSQTDIQTISNWLTGHGLQVDAASKDRMTIRFSGTAAQVQSTFHTEIHNLQVGKEAHIGNMSDPQIPAALVPAVVGVKTLHNFFPRPMHKLGSKVQFNREAGNWQRVAGEPGSTPLSAKVAMLSRAHPEFASNASEGIEEDVAPYDFATIYNVLPLWNKGTDGTGQTIAIAGTSLIDLSDVASFRSVFGLPAGPTPIQINANGSASECTGSSGPCTLDDLTENTVDVEWSGAVAKGAQIKLVVSGPTSPSTDTVYDSAQYVVKNTTAHILSVSYGLCELGEGTTGNAAYDSLWSTAATEGIAVFVASGDSGSALCDDGEDQQYGTPWAAIYGKAVNGLASSQYDTAVGGTDFNWCDLSSPSGCQPSAPYWSTSNNSTTGASALNYVPEVPWNNTCTNPLVLSILESDATTVGYSGTVKDAEQACNFIATDSVSILQNPAYDANISFFVDTTGGSGGASTCTTNNGSSVSSCSGGHAKPSWQVNHTINDSKRDLPDVSFFAANGFLNSAYLMCVSPGGAACVTSTAVGSEPTSQEIGGTSVSTPAMAGVMALINQSAGSSQGSPNAQLYTLANLETYGNCSAATVTASSSCYFNDINTGTISMPCDYGAADGGIVYDSSGNPIYDQSDVQAGIDSPDCMPTHSGDKVGLLQGVDAGVGYDLATGLGSLNVANVVNAWPASTTPYFSVSGTSVTVNQGATTGNTSPITVTPTNGFTGTVAFTCAVTTAPTGATSPVTCTPPSSVDVTSSAAVTTTTPLTVASTANTTPGAYAVTVTGKSGGLTETAIVSVTVVNPNATFTMSAGAASPTQVAPGGTAVSNVTLTAVAGYSGSVTFGCTQTSGPSNPSGDNPVCEFPNTPVAVGTSTPFSIETIATVASSELTWPSSSGKGGGSRRQQWAGAGGVVLALLVFLGIPARRRSWRAMLGGLGMLVALAVLSSVAACGGGGGPKNPGNPGTAAGTYVFTVTGTGNPVPPAAVPPVTITVVVN